MKIHLYGVCMVSAVGIMLSSLGVLQPARAQLPTPTTQRPGVSQAQVGDMVMTYGEQTALERRLAKAVVVVRADYGKQHSLALDARVFDGAAAAIHASALAEVVEIAFASESAGKAPVQDSTHSFFDDSYRRASSPFADKSPEEREPQAKRQYFLTTADWLTGARNITIARDKKDYPAKLEYRDDAQNVAVLSTTPLPGIESVSIYDFDAHEAILPGVAFLLLQPQTLYQRMTQHVFSLMQSHVYATSNHAARNGYPMFTRQGELVGLSVGPTPAHTQAYIVHAGLIDRALHPKKYSRTKIEKIELQER